MLFAIALDDGDRIEPEQAAARVVAEALALLEDRGRRLGHPAADAGVCDGTLRGLRPLVVLCGHDVVAGRAAETPLHLIGAEAAGAICTPFLDGHGGWTG